MTNTSSKGQEEKYIVTKPILKPEDIKKIVFVVFNRATFCRVMATIAALANDEEFDCHLILCGGILAAKFGGFSFVREELKGLDVTIHKCEAHYWGKNLTQIASTIQLTLDKKFRALKPKAIFVIGDRFETLPAALASAYNNFITIHLQGGEVTGSIDERVRHAVTKLSDYHFVATEMAAKYVAAMGEDNHRIFEVGCPSIDVLGRAQSIGAIERRMTKERYIICMFHPDTQNSEEHYREVQFLYETLEEFCMKTACKLYWFWPNPDPGREKIIQFLEKAEKNNGYLIKMVNQPPREFLKRVANCKFVIGNSSVALRECSYLGVPAINVTGRQAMRERSWNVKDVDLFNREFLLTEMELQWRVKKYDMSFLYGRGRASQFILSFLRTIDYTQKGTIRYPKDIQYKEHHTGEARFKKHSLNRRKYASREEAELKRLKHSYLQCKPIGVAKGNFERSPKLSGETNTD